MRRRDFIVLAGGAAWPRAVRAEQGAPPLVGFMHSGAPSDYTLRIIASFREGLKDIGFVDGQNVAIEYRWAEGHYDRLPALAADLIARQPALIFAAGGSEPARAVMANATTIPTVFVTANDPVETGLVSSINRPGGNVTGVGLVSSALEAKRVELLHELVPKAATIAALINPNYPSANAQKRAVQEAADRLGIKPIVLSAAGASDIEPAFSAMAQQGVAALLVAQDPVLVAFRQQFVALAERYALPVIYSQRDYVIAGGLISYGPDFADGYRQAGHYVGRILKGEKPGDLPVMQPTKFELFVNLKTAKALGIAVPQTLLVAADEVIE